MSDIIHIGFLEECESWRLQSRFFPSKVGGKPAWLDLKNIPDNKKLACNYCKNPCIFLCQVYAPFEEDIKAFHRTLYVFICKNFVCCKENYNGNVKVIRSQLERVNEFYLSDPPVEAEDWRPDICVEKWSKTCNVCGIFSSNCCSKCKTTNYCSRLHQIWDWKFKHKELCGKEEIVYYKTFLFPEFQLVMEIEHKEHKTIFANQNKDLELENFIKTDKVGTLQSEKVDDLLKMANSIEDKTFSIFRKRIQNNPEQVIRYNRGGKPLFISSNYKPLNIPNCEICGEERQFEFQIMPQLLLYLNIKDILNDIDWGILAIYTCKNSCTSQCTKYIEEYIWKQDIVKDESK